jgi:glutathione S-transferase
MYELFIGNKNYSSWSLRPWVLLEARGIPFAEKLINFPPGDSYDYFRAYTPSGRVPGLRDGDTVVWDSLAIVEYLAERHPGVWPADAAARAWSRSVAAEMHSSFPALRSVCSMNCGIRVKLHERSPALERDIARIGEIWNEGLSRFGGPFLAGPEFTGADAFYAPVVFRAQTYGLAFGGAADGYVRRMLDLPAMREWYAAALAEPWREAGHEGNLATVGEVTADLRTG